MEALTDYEGDKRVVSLRSIIHLLSRFILYAAQVDPRQSRFLQATLFQVEHHERAGQPPSTPAISAQHAPTPVIALVASSPAAEPGGQSQGGTSQVDPQEPSSSSTEANMIVRTAGGDVGAEAGIPSSLEDLVAVIEAALGEAVAAGTISTLEQDGSA